MVHVEQMLRWAEAVHGDVVVETILACGMQLLLDLLARAASRAFVPEVCGPPRRPLIWANKFLGEMGNHSRKRRTGDRR